MKVTMTNNQFITVDGYMFSHPREVPDNTVFRAISDSRYAEDFVGPPRPVTRGELGELLGFRIVSSTGVPSVKEKTSASLPKPKGPKKHWRRW